MKIFKKNPKLLALFLCFLGSFSVFAQASEELSDVYKRIDMAIAAKSSEAISKVLADNRYSPNYQMIENYTL